MVSEAEVWRKQTSNVPSPAPDCAMKLAAFDVISVKPAPGVSTRKVVVAISCGVASVIFDRRPGIRRNLQCGSDQPLRIMSF